MERLLYTPSWRSLLSIPSFLLHTSPQQQQKNLINSLCIHLQSRTFYSLAADHSEVRCVGCKEFVPRKNNEKEINSILQFDNNVTNVYPFDTRHCLSTPDQMRWLLLVLIVAPAFSAFIDQMPFPTDFGQPSCIVYDGDYSFAYLVGSTGVLHSFSEFLPYGSYS